MSSRREKLIDYIETEIVWNLQHDDIRIPMEELQGDLKDAKKQYIGARILTRLFWKYGVE